MREQPADDPGVLLHRVQIALRIAAPERHPRDEVVEDEIVQDDHPGSLPERVHDPGVRLGVVADVVEADVRSARRLLRSSADDGDVQSLLERREQQRAVVGDSRALRGQRGEVRDPQEASSRSTTASHVTRSAVCLPARPRALA